LAVVMETELWPNLFVECRQRRVPIVVANGRLSEQSMRGYRPVAWLASMAVKAVTLVAAQSQADADRFVRLGTDPARVMVVGNIKFDLRVPDGLAERASRELSDIWGKGRPVWVAASTHADDEVPVMQAFARVLKRFPDALLVLVPRHPERFQEAVNLCRTLGYRTQQRSQVGVCDANTQCFVADTMGELLLFYAAADLAFIGGSFAKVGGHNALEAAALAKPVLVGPHNFNFAEVTAWLIEQGGAKQVDNPEQLADAVIQLLSDTSARQRMGRAAYIAMQHQRGAKQRIVEAIAERLSQQG
jgi:3-deoxy-D-manno-octulosonic-acid transferase